MSQTKPLFFADVSIITAEFIPSSVLSLSFFSILRQQFSKNKKFNLKNIVTKLFSVAANSKPHFSTSLSDLSLRARPYLMFDPFTRYLYASDEHAHIIVRIEVDTGRVEMVAGIVDNSGRKDGPRLECLLNTPRSMVVDSKGYFYFSESSNHIIRRIDFATGEVSTYCGDRKGNSTAEAVGERMSVKLSYPNGLSIDPQDNIYFCNSGTETVMRISPSGTVTEVNIGHKLQWNSWTCCDPLSPNKLIVCDRDEALIYICTLGEDKSVVSTTVLNNKVPGDKKGQAEGLYYYDGKLYASRFSEILMYDISTKEIGPPEVLVPEAPNANCITGNLASNCLYFATKTGVYMLQ